MKDRKQFLEENNVLSESSQPNTQKSRSNEVPAASVSRHEHGKGVSGSTQRQGNKRPADQNDKENQEGLCVGKRKAGQSIKISKENIQASVNRAAQPGANANAGNIQNLCNTLKTITEEQQSTYRNNQSNQNLRVNPSKLSEIREFTMAINQLNKENLLEMNTTQSRSSKENQSVLLPQNYHTCSQDQASHNAGSAVNNSNFSNYSICNNSSTNLNNTSTVAATNASNNTHYSYVASTNPKEQILKNSITSLLQQRNIYKKLKQQSEGNTIQYLQEIVRGQPNQARLLAGGQQHTANQNPFSFSQSLNKTINGSSNNNSQHKRPIIRKRAHSAESFAIFQTKVINQQLSQKLSSANPAKHRADFSQAKRKSQSVSNKVSSSHARSSDAQVHNLAKKKYFKFHMQNASTTEIQFFEAVTSLPAMPHDPCQTRLRS